MSDWQPGDLAMCVNDSILSCPGEGFFHVGNAAIKKGAIWVVSSLGQAKCGCPQLVQGNGITGHLPRFQKIGPHTPDADDRETIRLLTGVPCDA